MEKGESGGIAKTDFFRYVTIELKTGLFNQWREKGSGYPQNILIPLIFLLGFRIFFFFCFHLNISLAVFKVNIIRLNSGEVKKLISILM